VDILHSWPLYPPANPSASTHHFPTPPLSLECSDLVSGVETQRLGWKSMELVTLCGGMLMDLTESCKRDAWLKKESWDIQRECADIEKEEYLLSLRRREGRRQGRHGEQAYSYRRVGNGQDRAPGRFFHGPAHPGFSLAQRKEQRQRSGDSMAWGTSVIRHQHWSCRAPVLPLWSCSSPGKAEQGCFWKCSH